MAKRPIQLDEDKLLRNREVYPTLSLEYSKHLSDFEVEHIRLQVIGEDSKIVKDNMNWLLNCVINLRNDNNKNGGSNL